MIDVTDWNEKIGLLTKQHVEDIVECLYGANQKIFVHSRMKKGESKDYRGLASWENKSETHLWIDCHKTVSDFMSGKAVGGNVPLSRGTDPRLAVAQVLAHEIRHATQRFMHRDGEGSFWGKPFRKYTSRACERDARLSAEEAVPIVKAILEIDKIQSPVPPSAEQELEEIAQFLDECCRNPDGSVSDEKIIRELKLSGLNNFWYMKKTGDRLDALRVSGSLAPIGLGQSGSSDI